MDRAVAGVAGRRRWIDISAHACSGTVTSATALHVAGAAVQRSGAIRGRYGFPRRKHQERASRWNACGSDRRSMGRDSGQWRGEEGHGEMAERTYREFIVAS